MNKFYAPLHIVIRKLRKPFLCIGLLLFFILYTAYHAGAQCNNSNASGVVTAPSPGNTIQINACAMAGDYSTINTVIASTSYTVTSTTGTDLFTIRQSTPGGPVIAFGITPLTWTSTTAGTYYVHINSNASCGTQATCRTTAIRNNGTCTSPTVTVTPALSCGAVVGTGPCNPLTASGADSYTWFPFTGLFTNCTYTTPYVGQNTAVVYAAPTVNTGYVVTGTITATGCSKTATAIVKYTPPPVIVPPSVNMCIGDPPVKIKTVATPSTLSFCSGPVNIPVPDNNVAGVSNRIFVSGIPPACTITNASVTINMTHTRVGDMVFVLKGPNGQVINLDYHLSINGGSGTTTGFTNTVIGTSGTVGLSAGTNPYTATFRADLLGPGPYGGYGPGGPTGFVPTSNVWPSLFAIPNGTWTLAMYDGIGSNTGTLVSWCLNISFSCQTIPSTPAVWTPSTGLFSDPAAAVPYVAGTPVDSVWVKPVIAGVYTYAATVQSVNTPISFTNPATIVIPTGGAATPYPSDVMFQDCLHQVSR